MHEASEPRKGKDLPYITLPRLLVKSLKKGFGVDVEIMGLFHDLLEDTKATEKKIKSLSNDEVYEAVVLVTKTDKDTKKYIGRISNNKKASAVKIADRRTFYQRRLQEVNQSPLK